MPQGLSMRGMSKSSSPKYGGPGSAETGSTVKKKYAKNEMQYSTSEVKYSYLLKLCIVKSSDFNHQKNIIESLKSIPIPINSNSNILFELRRPEYFDINSASVFLWLCSNNYTNILKYFFDLMVEYKDFTFLYYVNNVNSGHNVNSVHNVYL